MPFSQTTSQMCYDRGTGIGLEQGNPLWWGKIGLMSCAHVHFFTYCRIFNCKTGKSARRQLIPGINTNHAFRMNLKRFRVTERTARAILGVLDSPFGVHLLANQVIGARCNTLSDPPNGRVWPSCRVPTFIVYFFKIILGGDFS